MSSASGMLVAVGLTHIKYTIYWRINMDYKTAELSQESVEQLSQLEQDLSNEAGKEIVLIAYQKGQDKNERQ